ncbi:hypothetical protein ACUNWD_20400 [Sunxiuqinia sp. A32]|uniref:hypothetical protein n=1 Tax=Sunxiuqinia sp. A32 TaxID=3461496 RepID=UPI004045A19E
MQKTGFINIGLLLLLLFANESLLNAQTDTGELVPAPIFVDPNYHGSCDPEIVWNESSERYFIYYTARKGNQENTFLGTPIGVISSSNLADWRFEGYCMFDGIGGKKDAEETFWAPAIISTNGFLHLFITYKPDTIPTKGAWGGPGKIVHYKTSLKDPIKGWVKVEDMHDSTINALDATVYKNENLFHVWYKGKKQGATKNELYHLTSSDFENWENQGFSKSDVFNEKATGSSFEEAPYIFQWKDSFWLITDPHDGFFVYKSIDGENWIFQGTILKEGGTRNLDTSMARHCSVIVNNDRAFIFYHVEPWRRYDLEKKKGKDRLPIFKQPAMNRRSVLQMAELELLNGQLVCDRNKSIVIN